MRSLDLPDSIQEKDFALMPRARTCTRAELTHYLKDWLDVPRFKDASYNGLQVAGRETIASVVTGVTANKALIDAAIEQRADAIIVHHGLFWKGDDPRIVGFHRERVRALLEANINLYAYHLPLDAHPEAGNNACLGRRMGFNAFGSTGESGLVMLGRLGCGVAVRSQVFAAYCARHFGRRVTLFASSPRLIRTVAWCTGAGGSLLRDAIDADADAFVTGEIAEHHIHLARESGVTLITAGHHATERDGVNAVGEQLATHFGLQHQFIDVDSPL